MKMTINDQQLKIIFEQLGLEIPDEELRNIAQGVKFIDEMRSEVRKLKSNSTEPAHTVSFPKDKQ